MSKTKEIQAPKWEMKDRRYFLLQDKEPLTYTLNSKNTSRHPLLWFDEKTGAQRELRYATNQNSPFVDEQKGEATMGHIVFEEGVLNVGKHNQNLQKLLSLYHPRKDTTYKEFEPHIIAEDEVEKIHSEIEALMFAKELDIVNAEAILRVDKGSYVYNMSSKEIKRDLRLFANRNPELFLELAQDENVGLRNTAIKATEAGIIALSQDQRTFSWTSNGRKLMSVPFDENPYSAMAAWFKTDEGLEVYRSIEKKFK